MSLAAVRSVAVTMLASAWIASVAAAGDGVIEINQTCATETGCFAGDDSGFPVTIRDVGRPDGAPGRSFVLTGDLVLPSPTSTGISILSNDVTIDLGGFGIIRGACRAAGSTVSCRTSGSGTGILAGSAIGTHVHNGSVVGAGAVGIDLGSSSIVSDVEVRWSGADGVEVDPGSLILDSRSAENGGRGFLLERGSVIAGSVAEANVQTGIYAAVGGTVVRDSTAVGNFHGVLSDTGVSVLRVTATRNLRHGIFSQLFGGLIADSVSSDNGDDGLVCGTCLVEGVTASGNGTLPSPDGTVQPGMSIFGQSGHRENVADDNPDGGVLGGAALAPSLCDGNTTCP